MARLQYGDTAYSAYTVGNGIRFQFNNKLIKEIDTPPQVVAYLKQGLGIVDKPKEPSHFDQATAPAEAAKVQPSQPLSYSEASELNPEDFEDIKPVAHQIEVQHNEPAPNPFYTEPVAPEALPQPDLMYTPQTPQIAQRTFTEDDMRLAYNMGSDDAAKAIQEIQQVNQNSTTPEEFTIHGAPLEDLARAMYERFGIYTVFLGSYPEVDEISPLTGERMTSYDRGVAYQGARRAFEQGRLLGADYVAIKEDVERSRLASVNYVNNAPTQANIPQADAAPRNSFDYRTSVQGAQEGYTHSVANPEDPSEPIAEPSFGQQVIRPNW